MQSGDEFDDHREKFLCPLDRAARSDGSGNGRPLSSVNGSVCEDRLSSPINSILVGARSITHRPVSCVDGCARTDPSRSPLAGPVSSPWGTQLLETEEIHRADAVRGLRSDAGELSEPHQRCEHHPDVQLRVARQLQAHGADEPDLEIGRAHV